MEGITLLSVTIALSTVALCIGADGNKPLIVRIIEDYNPPSTFSLDRPSYRAASPLTLACVVENVDPTITLDYVWHSTCTGNCFVRGQVTANISTPYLHSYDSGVHTCTVYDIGCVGNASITVNVVGAGIYVQAGKQVLPQNGLILTRAQDDIIPSFRCLSGSSAANVGSLIGPQGDDITLSSFDPFSVSRGSHSDPGTLFVRSIRLIRREDTGIYTYRTPDEAGNLLDFHFGVYYQDHSGPSISKMSYSLSEDQLNVSCTSHSSPPTKIIWEKGRQRIHFNSSAFAGYRSTHLINRTSSEYSNVLTITAFVKVDDITGMYACTVVNSLGRSVKHIKQVKAVEVSGHETPVFVGLPRNITCLTHLSHVKKMEWLLEGQTQPIEERVGNRNKLTLLLNPRNASLNGAKYTCRITVPSGRTIMRTITAVIQEFTHEVNIENSSSPLPGSKYLLTCTVTADLTPTVKWLDPDNNEINGSDLSISTSQAISDGNTTNLVLTLEPLKTSHAGAYSCVSSIQQSHWIAVAVHQLSVQIPAGTVAVTRSPSSGTLYTSDALALTCVTTLTSNMAIDVPVRVSHQWTGPGGVINTGNGTLVGDVIASPSGLDHRSNLSISSLRSSQSGTYTCFSVVAPVYDSEHILQSTTKMATIFIPIALKVRIVTTYTSPDVYPVYSPPNYRAASGPVKLKCEVTGTAGQVTYQWSSTCSRCFASSSRWRTISEEFVRPRDDGTHTCTVLDGNGNSGSANTTMNIVGAGIYVSYAAGSSRKGRHNGRHGAQPANSYIIPFHYRPTYYTRLDMHCCSSIKSEHLASRVIITTNEQITSYFPDSTTAGDYGCLRIRIYRPPRESFSLQFPGVYTCQFEDGEANMLNVNFAVYDQDSSVTLSIHNIQYNTFNDGSIELVCQAHSFFTAIKWYRNGVLIDLSASFTNGTLTILNRANSSYESALSIQNSPELVTGNYTCRANGYFGYDEASITIHGVQASCPEGTVGSTINCTCSSDIQYSNIQWHYGSQLKSISETVAVFVSTDAQDDVYLCSMFNFYGSLTTTATIATIVPDNWATIEITTLGQEFTENMNYSLTCKVRVTSGMNLPVRMEWVGPDGVVVRSDGNRTVGEVPRQGTLSTLTLSFHPVYVADGGRYTCRAAVTVPWMTRQPTQQSTSVLVAVTGQAMFQLKISPVPNCLNLNVDKARGLITFIKRGVQKGVRDRCGCPFSSSVIFGEKISCQTIGDSLTTNLIYRATLNGTSDFVPPVTALEHIQDWVDSEGGFDYYFFHLKLAKTSQCKLKIESMIENEC